MNNKAKDWTTESFCVNIPKLSIPTQLEYHFFRGELLDAAGSIGMASYGRKGKKHEGKRPAGSLKWDSKVMKPQLGKYHLFFGKFVAIVKINFSDFR